MSVVLPVASVEGLSRFRTCLACARLSPENWRTLSDSGNSRRPAKIGVDGPFASRLIVSFVPSNLVGGAFQGWNVIIGFRRNPLLLNAPCCVKTRFELRPARGGPCQGLRVLQDAEDREEALGLAREVAESGCDRAAAIGAGTCEGGVAEGGQVLRRVPLRDRGAVLSEHRVPHPMQPVLDHAPGRINPVSADDLQQSSRPGLVACQRGDEVADLTRLLARSRRLADHAEDLFHARPLHVLVERGGADQGANFQPTVSLVDLSCLAALTRALLLGPGGKRPRRRPRIPAKYRGKASVDSL